MEATLKRTKLILLLTVLALVAAACGDDEPAATTATTKPPVATTTATTTAPTTVAPLIGEGKKLGMAFDVGGRGDKSFNDLAAASFDKAISEYGVEGKELAPTAGGENREENLRLLSEAGMEFIIANGFAFSQNVGRVAQEFPDTYFAITDSCAQGEDFATLDLPNVSCMLFAEEQGSFLVGAAAALKSESGTVGFIGGVEVPLIKKFQAGFEAGVAHIDPDAKVLVTYLTQVPDFSGFSTPSLGNEAAQAMLDDGADVIYHASGGSGTGMFQAIKDRSVADATKYWGIGVDSDQYNTVGADLQEYVLTSMLKRVDVAVDAQVLSWINGSFKSGPVEYDLAAEGVGYSKTGGFVDDIADQLDGLAKDIISGTIKVPTEPAA